jgi:hypothetical protein
LKFAGRAVREIGEAFDWYEEQSKGLGSEFELAFERGFDSVSTIHHLTPSL